MRALLVAALLSLVVSSCASSELSTVTTIREDRLRPLDHVGTWVAPPSHEDELWGSWTASTTLTLDDDGTYRFEGITGFDEGTYRVRQRAGVLRLETVGSRLMCFSGNVDRKEFEVVDLPSIDAQRLSFETSNRCGRPEFPAHLDRTDVKAIDDLTGEWRRDGELTLARGRYKLVTSVGSDEGTMEYDEDRGGMTLVTTGGDMCDVGATAVGSVSTSVNTPVGSLVFHIRDDDCFPRAGMSQWFEWVGAP